jgi:putative tryptophan/tyrosine transport system substrate-binding protein
MKRREFLTLLGAATASTTPLSALAQQPAMPVVGILSGTNREPRLVGAIQQGLAESGYTEGRNVALEYRFAEGRFERLPELAADLVQRGVAVIVAMQSAAAPQAAKAVTSSIPIVFSIGGDPVKLGLVASLNQPGGNVTGATFLVNTLAAKRLELLRELVPAGATIGLLFNPKNPASGPEKDDVLAAARELHLEIHAETAGSESEIDAAFARFVEKPVSAVTFAADAVYNSRRAQLVALAARHKLPTMYFYRAFAEAGGLISYGGFDTDAYRLAGVYAGRILKGEKPADLPVQQSTRVELVVNLKTAKAQGVTIPTLLLARAEEVIE